MVRKGSSVQVRLRALRDATGRRLTGHPRRSRGGQRAPARRRADPRPRARHAPTWSSPTPASPAATPASSRTTASVTVEDLGSSNGTYVNGERISGPVELGTGDEVQIGATILGVEGDRPHRPDAPGAPRPRTRPAAPPCPAAALGRRPAASPHPQPGNIPALAALFLGPLSILLVFLSTGGFFLALPCGIAADRPRHHRHPQRGPPPDAATAPWPASAGSPEWSARSSP